MAEAPSEGGLQWGIQVFNDALSALEGEKRAGVGPRGTEGDNRAMLVSPALDLSLLKQPVLTFYRYLTADDNMSMLGYSDTLNVYYRESSEAEWQLLSALTGEANLAVPGMMQWASADISLPSSSAQTQLAFEVVSKIAGKSIYIDNIEVYDNAVTIAEFPWEEHFENNPKSVCFSPSRRRSGLRRGVAGNRMRTKAGKMPESLIFPIRNGHGVSNDRFGIMVVSLEDGRQSK